MWPVFDPFCPKPGFPQMQELEHLAVVELHSGGHHPAYLSALLEGFVQTHGLHVSLAVPAEVERTYRERHSDISERFSIHRLPPLPGYRNLRCLPLSWRVFNVRRFASLARVLRGLEGVRGRSFRAVFFPTLYDNAWTGFGLTRSLFPYDVAGIYMNSNFFRAGREAYRRECIASTPAFLRDKRFRAIALLDPGIEKGVRTFAPQAHTVVLPDFADEVAPRSFPEGEAAIARAGSRRPIIGLFGFLKRSKGVVTFLEVARRLGDRAHFLLAGELYEPEFSSAEKAHLAAAARGEFPYLSYLPGRIADDSAFHWLVKQADLLYLAYEHFHSSSNQLSLALTHRRAALVPENSCMAEQAKGFARVIPTNTASVDAVASTLTTVLDRASWQPLTDPSTMPSGLDRASFISAVNRQLVAALLPSRP
jgi:glycosyltransferase involved in cell wall biosynthesis